MKIRSLISIITFAVAATCALAQQPSAARFTQENGDCTGAIPINDSIFIVDHPVRGFGNKLEIKENPAVDTHWFEREHHTTWYTFRVPVSCDLTFDIIPKDPQDDIDFLLFEGAIPGICDKIASEKVIPVRSNISRNDPALASRCGLSKDAQEDYVRSGVGASYSRSISVEAGQLMYLVIDHQNRPRAGYTIHFHFGPVPIAAEEIVELPRSKQKVFINILDQNTRAPLEASIAVEGMMFDQVIEGTGRSAYNYEMDLYRTLKVTCVRKGYMFSSKNVKGSTDPEVKVDLELRPIAEGEHVVLGDIRFVGDADRILRGSESSLFLLLRFMQANPDVRIEIQGHVNGPTFKNKKEFIQLSTARARTVYDFLLVNDIEPSRISYKGYGNSQMLFPDPKSAEESEANRRVEIKVLGNQPHHPAR